MKEESRNSACEITYFFDFVQKNRKMNKHVNKLNYEAADARKMIEDSESESDDSDDENKRNGGRKNAAKSGEKPSEDQVEKLEEKLEAAQADQKNLFLIIFQVFVNCYVITC
jgi:nuclear cap-binding protein subunit 1